MYKALYKKVHSVQSKMLQDNLADRGIDWVVDKAFTSFRRANNIQEEDEDKSEVFVTSLFQHETKLVFYGFSTLLSLAFAHSRGDYAYECLMRVSAEPSVENVSTTAIYASLTAAYGAFTAYSSSKGVKELYSLVDLFVAPLFDKSE